MNDKLVLYALIPTVNITIKTCQYFINSLKAEIAYLSVMPEMKSIMACAYTISFPIS